MPKFRVKVDDHFNYLSEEDRYTAGEFDALDEAVQACRAIVDKSLLHLFRPEMSARQLFDRYLSFGEDPWIEGGAFSAFDYARQRCDELCAPPERT